MKRSRSSVVLTALKKGIAGGTTCANLTPAKTASPAQHSSEKICADPIVKEGKLCHWARPALLVHSNWEQSLITLTP